MNVGRMPVRAEAGTAAQAQGWLVQRVRLAARHRPVPRLSSRRAAAVEETSELAAVEQEETFDGPDDGLGLTSQQVQTLVHTLCDDTRIAQMELKIGKSFTLSVKRLAAAEGPAGVPSSFYGGSNGASVIPIPPPGTAFQSTASMDFTDMTMSMGGSYNATQSLDEEEEEESTIFLESPKVGFMRRGRYVKGKKVGKGLMAQEGDQVKKGQVLGFVEQLGTYVPIEAPQAGELITFLLEEGAAVEYKQEVAEIAPFFGGHIIGDRKNA